MQPEPHPAAPGEPVWHVAPDRGWLNDPNGLVVADGRWHAFHQHHPDSDRWGPMHWGHVSSVDGLHWRRHPIALEPDGSGTIFSGSAILDVEGVAGFGRGAWVAFFTHHAGDRQHQSIAWSQDGDTWTKYDGNPVIVGDAADFRDPKVVRLPDGRWSMVVSLADHLAFFVSADLLHWECSGEFRADLGDGVGNWECPDMVPLGGGRWLLVISLSTGGPNGHSGTVVVPGRFDGAVFEPSAAPVTLDHGPDCYAFQTFSNAGASHPVGMAWMNSWRYANEVPSAGRRGLLSLPRRLSWHDGDVLRSWPAVSPVEPVVPGAMWVDAVDDVVVEVAGAGGVVRAGVERGEVFVERSGDVADGYDGRFSAAADGGGPHLIVVDQGCIEVFAAGGRTAMTAQVFAGPSPTARVPVP